MRASIFLGLLLAPLATVAQTYPVANRSLTFFDASRNRNIATEVHYPGVSAGANAPVASGTFPVLVMGHGFVMTVSAYYNLRDHFVPRGYILVLPTTEGGFSPNHGAFGQDLAFLAQAMQAAGADDASPFFGHVAPATALMGHSMGGGASFLGAANNLDIQALVNFAPAETNPSAIAAAANVQVPTLVFAGSNDCVTPIAQHQGPMYAALNTPCRAFVNITGGGHCYFANDNFNCSFGELTCSPSPAISRAAQHDVVNDLAALWLDHFLRGDQEAFEAFGDSMALTSRATTQFTCITTTTPERSADDLSVWPIPVNDRLFVSGVQAGASYRVVDASGRTVRTGRFQGTSAIIDVQDLGTGVHRLLVHGERGQRVKPFLVVH